MLNHVVKALNFLRQFFGKMSNNLLIQKGDEKQHMVIIKNPQRSKLYLSKTTLTYINTKRAIVIYDKNGDKSYRMEKDIILNPWNEKPSSIYLGPDIKELK